MLRFYTPNVIGPGDLGAVPPRDTASAQITALFADEAIAARVLRNVDVFGIFAYLFGADAPTDAMWQRAIPLLARYGCEVSMEVGGPLGYNPPEVLATDTGGQNGIKSANYDLTRAILPWEALGGTLDYLFMDGGLHRTIVNGSNTANGLNMTIAESCAEMVAYMQRILAMRPNMRFILGDNVILWPYQGVSAYSGLAYPAAQRPDFDLVWDELIVQLTTAGIRSKLVAFYMDHSVDYLDGLIGSPPASTADDWYGRVFKVQQQVEADGVLFGQGWIGAWGGDPQFDATHAAPFASDAYYQRLILHQAEALEAYRLANYPAMGLNGMFSQDNFYYHPRVLTPPTTRYSTEDTYLRALVAYSGERLQAGARASVDRTPVSGRAFVVR